MCYVLHTVGSKRCFVLVKRGLWMREGGSFNIHASVLCWNFSFGRHSKQIKLIVSYSLINLGSGRRKVSTFKTFSYYLRIWRWRHSPYTWHERNETWANTPKDRKDVTKSRETTVKCQQLLYFVKLSLKWHCFETCNNWRVSVPRCDITVARKTRFTTCDWSSKLQRFTESTFDSIKLFVTNHEQGVYVIN